MLFSISFTTFAQSQRSTNVKVVNSSVVRQSADEVWKKLKSFGGLEKFTPEVIEKTIVTGTGVGVERTLVLTNNQGNVVEKLTNINERKMTIVYKMISTPMPLQNYVGKMRVVKVDSNSCEVFFTSTFSVTNENKINMSQTLDTFQKVQLSNLHL